MNRYGHYSYHGNGGRQGELGQLPARGMDGELAKKKFFWMAIIFISALSRPVKSHSLQVRLSHFHVTSRINFMTKMPFYIVSPICYLYITHTFILVLCGYIKKSHSFDYYNLLLLSRTCFKHKLEICSMKW